MKKRILAFALAAATLASVAFTGCQPKEITVPEDGGFTSVSFEPSKDKYRNYYEIFVYSFCDSNGDGIGDFKGITSKLDYLNDGDPSTTTDLGIDGIWLMPIMPSPSYHKYDVEDYLSVDSAYGTKEDFKELVDECHKRGINVIIDLVINHSSSSHEWFKKAKEELAQGKTDGYAQYYNFKQSSTKPGSNWYSAVGLKGWYYESSFTQNMPDLNLKNPDVQEEIKNICKYWLQDVGIDGFRLDAAYHYDPSASESINDINWLNEYCKTLKEDVYMVAEVWQGGNIISDFYKSGLDSFFNFDLQGTAGKVVSTVNTKNANDYVAFIENWQNTIKANNPNAIDAPFISNHDTARSSGFLTRDTTREKTAAMLYLMTPGNPFIYYGEEIAMSGSETDPDKRTGMVWSLSDDTGYVPKIPGASNTEKPDEGVEEAQKNENSLLNFYKKLIRLKLQNPEIARGTYKHIELDASKPNIGAYTSEYNGSKVMVIYNVAEETAQVNVPQSTFSYSEVRGYAVGDTTVTDKVAFEGETLTLPPCSVVVLK